MAGMNDTARFVVLSSAPDADSAQRLARALVGEGLAACVNVLPGARSIYRWKGEIHEDAECLLLAKTDGAHLTALINAIEDNHPYDCPEVIALPIAEGSTAYLRWLDATLRSEDDAGSP